MVMETATVRAMMKATQMTAGAMEAAINAGEHIQIEMTACRLKVNFLEAQLRNVTLEAEQISQERDTMREALETELGSLRTAFVSWTQQLEEDDDEEEDDLALELDLGLEEDDLEEDDDEELALRPQPCVYQAEDLSLAQNPLLPLMMSEHPRTVAETIAFTSAPVIITIAEYPYRIVYVNAAWTALCGWELHEVLGATCKILQGKNTNPAHTAQLCESVRKTGYAAAELINYKKNGTPFLNRVVLLPVVSDGLTNVVVTNTGGILEGVSLPASVAAAAADPEIMARVNAGENGGASRNQQYMTGYNPLESSRDALLHSLTFELLPAQTGSLSVALDYMAWSSEPLILTDSIGRICSVNAAWVGLCGYTAAEVEGRTCRILQGQDTDMAQIAVLNDQIRRRVRAEATIINYKKGHRRFVNNVVVLPIYSTRGTDTIRPSLITGPTMPDHCTSHARTAPGDCYHFIARLQEVEIGGDVENGTLQ